MNKSILKTTISLTVIICLIIMSIKTQQSAVNSKLFASLGIILGAIATKNLSTRKPMKR